MDLQKIIPFQIFISNIPPLQPQTGDDYDYNAGYKIEIKLICRLTKKRDQALISISKIK